MQPQMEQIQEERDLEAQLADKNSCLEKLRGELSVSQKRIEELEIKDRNCKESDEKMKDLLESQTKQLEKTKLEIRRLEDSSSMNQEIKSLKSELELTKQNLGLIKNELKMATEAEENNKKAMDDLALVLKEVATEANQLKAKQFTTESELKIAKEEAANFKTLLIEARREADLYKSTVERLRLEAEESIMAWNDRETSLVHCIRRAEEDRYVTQQENRRLIDTLRLAELKTMTSKEEIKKLRDILKQALNEASVAKEAAGIAIEENSQLKDCMAEKENALDFLSSENENLKVNKAAAFEEIKELKRLFEETATVKEENKDQGVEKLKTQTSVEKEDTLVRRLGKAFSFSFMDFRVNSVKKKELEEESEIEETLKGSIFDEVDSPCFEKDHQKKSSSQFVSDGETVNDEDFDQLEENHFDDMEENERNSRKKKALIRRFGDLLMRRRSFQKKEQAPEQ